MDNKTDYSVMYEIFDKHGRIESSGNYKNGGCFFEISKNFSEDSSERIRFEFNDDGDLLLAPFLGDEMSRNYYSQLYDLTPDEYDNIVFKDEPFMLTGDFPVIKYGEDMIEDTREDPAMETPEWVPAENVRRNWFDSSAGIYCICGNKKLIILGDEPEMCADCGRIYRIVSYIEVTNYED